MAMRNGLQKSATMTCVTEEQHFLFLTEKRAPTSPPQIGTELFLREGITQPVVIGCSLVKRSVDINRF
jgi:hypothetical protein